MTVQHETPHEAALRWQEASIEHSRHFEAMDKLLDLSDRLDRVETLLTLIARAVGVVPEP